MEKSELHSHLMALHRTKRGREHVRQINQILADEANFNQRRQEVVDGRSLPVVETSSGFLGLEVERLPTGRRPQREGLCLTAFPDVRLIPLQSHRLQSHRQAVVLIRQLGDNLVGNVRRGLLD